MTALRVLLARLAGLLGFRRRDADLDDEIETLVACYTDEYLRAGHTPEEARRRAFVRIGGAETIRTADRDQRGVPLLETTLQDVRFGIRMLRRHRGYSVVAILTLALGVGTSTTMFSIVDAVMLRPFPFPDAERLVMIWETNPARAIDTFEASAANYLDWKNAARSFSDLGAWELRRDNRGDGALPVQVDAAVASAPLFRALGVAPAIGRFFRDDEDVPAGRFVAVLGYEYWHREFAGDAAMLGRSIVLNGEAHTIVGVMPAMRAPFRADVWRPLAADVAALDRGHHSMMVVGRLAPGQGMASAEAELRPVAARLAEAFAESNRGWSVRAESMYEALVPEGTRRAMLLLMAAVGVLLLMSCVNVASLTLARATSRTRELSTRFALGAGRGRLVRQLFTESTLVAAASAALGIVAASWLIDVVKWLYPADVSGLSEARLNPYAFLFAFIGAGATTLLFGLLPAYQISRQFRTAEHLSVRAATAGPRARALRQGFVMAQIALTLVLLIGSGLLLTSVNRLLNVPLGFVPEQVVTARVALNDRRFEDVRVYQRFIARVLGELQVRPGVAAAGVSSSVPFDGGYTVMQVRSEGDRDRPEAEGALTQWRVIGGDYLAAMNIPTLAGRSFTDADDRGVLPRSTIISQPLAEEMFGDRDPIGRHILVGDARRPYRVIGIAGAARLTSLSARPDRTMYFHYRQFDWPAMAIVVRAAGDPDTLAGVIRGAVAAADPSQPVFDERRMPAVIDAAAAQPQMYAALLTTFALLALILAAVGIYGTMSYAASQRLAEMSLRLVLGARPARVFFTMLGSGARITAVGVGAGVGIALLGAGWIGTLLFQVSAFDLPVWAAAVACVAAVAIMACGIPARRAMRADPVLMLRQD